MAKKTEDLTLDQKLQNALVPDFEQPYKVPENWVWTRTKNVVDIIMGQSPKGSDTTDDSNNIGLIGGAADMGDLFPNISRFTISPTKLSKTDDVILSIRATLGRPIFSDGEYCLGRGVSAIRSVFLSKEFLRYFYINFEDYLYDVATGSTFLQVNSEHLKVMPFPLPPLEEQQRIIDRVESLFKKLDMANELAQNALDTFENRKSAILHQAFTGELTKKWREEHGMEADSWQKYTLNDVCKSIFDGDHMPPPKCEKGVPFLVISNVNKGTLTFDNTRFVPKQYYDSLSDTRKPQIGDVLYTIVGSYGIPIVVDDAREFCFQRHMALLKPKSIDTRFLWYLLQTDEMYNKATEIATGTAQLTVPIKGLRQLSFLIPTCLEQTEIVRILDSIFSKEQQAKELADVIEKIDLMKKAILARAFRGELGTNDPTEESAVELLKEVLARSEGDTDLQMVKRTKSIKIDSEIESQLKTNIERDIYVLLLKKEKAEIIEILTVSKNHLEVAQSLSRLEKINLIQKNNGVYSCKEGSHANNTIKN